MLGYGPIGQFTIGQIGGTISAEVISPDKWFAALSEPARFRPGLKASQQQFGSLPDTLPFVSFSWFGQLSEPVRRLPRLPAGEQQFDARDLRPVVSFSWFNELSRPPRLTRPALSPSNQQTLAFNPVPFVSFGWFGNLSEPVRMKPGLRPPLQQFFATDTSAIPVSRMMEWYASLSEPPRFRSGLKTALQQFLATPSRLIPTPNITGTMSAKETKDTFLGALASWNRPASGEVGVVELRFTGAQVGIVRFTTATTVATAHVSITII